MLFSLQKFTDKILDNTEKEEEGRENPTAPSPGGGASTMCLGMQKFSLAKWTIKVRPAGDRTQSSQPCMNLLLFLPRQTHTPSCEQIMLASKIGWQS